MFAKTRITMTGEFPAQRVSNAEKCFHLMTSSWQIIAVKTSYKLNEVSSAPKVQSAPL